MDNKDTDRLQVWKYTVDTPAGHDWDAIKTTTIETLDFDDRVVSTHTRGTHEGDRVNAKHSYTFGEQCTPEGAAAYRRRNGYTRVS